MKIAGSALHKFDHSLNPQRATLNTFGATLNKASPTLKLRAISDVSGRVPKLQSRDLFVHGRTKNLHPNAAKVCAPSGADGFERDAWGCHCGTLCVILRGVRTTTVPPAFPEYVTMRIDLARLARVTTIQS